MRMYSETGGGHLREALVTNVISEITALTKLGLEKARIIACINHTECKKTVQIFHQEII